MKLLTCEPRRGVMPWDRIFGNQIDKRRYALRTKEFHLTARRSWVTNVFIAFVACNFVF